MSKRPNPRVDKSKAYSNRFPRSEMQYPTSNNSAIPSIPRARLKRRNAVFPTQRHIVVRENPSYSIKPNRHKRSRNKCLPSETLLRLRLLNLNHIKSPCARSVDHSIESSPPHSFLPSVNPTRRQIKTIRVICNNNNRIITSCYY